MNVDELRVLIAGLSPIPPAERFTWDFRRLSLREKILNDDPSKFLSWPVARECLYVGDTPESAKEFRYLVNSAHAVRYSMAVGRNPVGVPDKFSLDPTVDPNMLHQCYYIAQFEAVTGLRVSKFGDIYEFGGGYGAMKLLLSRLGFDGYYFIQDLPEFLYLQQYYLSNVGLDLLGTVFADWTPKLIVPDLLISCCSLSEVPVDLRDDILHNVKAKNYLIVYQHRFYDVDNHAYFQRLQGDMPGMQWWSFRSEFNTNHWFLIGKERQ